jgi:diguanylate cyclase (GGDEF)-like protein
MKQKNYLITDEGTLEKIIADMEIQSDVNDAMSTLIQIYHIDFTSYLFTATRNALLRSFPEAEIIGTTTVSQIYDCQISQPYPVVSFTFFKKTRIYAISTACAENDEFITGLEVSNRINGIKNIAAIMLLTTPLSINLNAMMAGFNQFNHNCPIFGGGAADYHSANLTYMLHRDNTYTKGIIAIVFSSKNLHCSLHVSSGWKPLSKEMQVTDSDGVWIKKINDQPAFDVYAKYLNVKNDPSFFHDAIDFPLIFNRNEGTFIRSPVEVNERKEIKFLGDVCTGENFSIGYGDPSEIISSISNIKDEIVKFQPDGLYVFACCCHHFLLQKDTELELEPLKNIAPTAGFYTYGEFFNNADGLQLLNSTLVVAAFREDEKATTPPMVDNSQVEHPMLMHKHSKIISRLVHFIRSVSAELEKSNLHLEHIAKTDKLTNLNNRLVLDEELNKHITIARTLQRADDQHFSVLLLDIDFFKKVNDEHGHLVGDEVLIQISETLTNSTRSGDVVGRWGGEEFMVIIPKCKKISAINIAEKLRRAIEEEVFSDGLKLTCSIGVCSFKKGDDHRAILNRADSALYMAKNNGRNQVYFL